MFASITGCNPSALVCLNCFCTTKEGAELGFPFVTESAPSAGKPNSFCAEGEAQKKKQVRHPCTLVMCTCDGIIFGFPGSFYNFSFEQGQSNSQVR